MAAPKGVMIEMSSGKAKIEISDFQSDRGNKFVTVRRFERGYKDKADQYYPQKFKKCKGCKTGGGMNMFMLSVDEWHELMPRLNQYFEYAAGAEINRAARQREEPPASSYDEQAAAEEQRQREAQSRAQEDEF